MKPRYAKPIVNIDAEIYYFLSHRHANEFVQEESIFFTFAKPSKVSFIKSIRQWLVKRSLIRLVKARYLVCKSEGSPALGVYVSIPELKVDPGWHRSYKVKDAVR